MVAKALEPAALGAPFLAVLLLSLIDGWWQPVNLNSPTVSRPRVIEGDQLSFSLELESERPIPWVELEVQFPATLTPTGPSRFVTALSGRRRFDIPVTANRWGSAGPEWAVVTTRDRFGVSELVTR